jgi:hypothetical protein
MNTAIQLDLCGDVIKPILNSFCATLPPSLRSGGAAMQQKERFCPGGLYFRVVVLPLRELEGWVDVFISLWQYFRMSID